MKSVETLPGPRAPRHRREQAQGWTSLADLEQDHIRYTLEHTFYNQSAAARLLRISRQALIRKIKRYDIEIPRHA